MAELEILVRIAVFKSANALVGWLLQQAAERVDASYQPKPGEVRADRQIIKERGTGGRFWFW